MTQGVPLAARVAGKYRPILRLAQGGMARVHLAVMESGPGVQKLVVVKELKPELAQDHEFVAMFVDEARLAARLAHPNVLTTYEIGESEAGPFLVMEYLDGQPLSSVLPRLGRAKFPLELHVWVLVQVLAGLHYAHELADFDGAPLCVVHRDVSPQNVLLCYDGHVKLLDFGIAKAAGSVARTETGVFKGKLGYIAPEQVTGAPIDRRADVFSVGVMLWEALAWRRLTHGDTEAQVLSKRTTGAHPRILDLNPQAPRELVQIAERAMALDPRDRYDTAADMQHALEVWLHGRPRVGARELAAALAAPFEAERAKVKRAIEEQLGAASLSGSFPRVSGWTGRSAPPPPAETSDRASAPPLSAVPPSSAPPAASLPPPVSQPPTGPVPPSAPLEAHVAASFGATRIVIVVATLGAAVLLLLLAIGAAARLGARTEQSAAASTEAPASGAAPASAVPTVTVHLEATPREATLRLDGAALGANPFRGAMPRDGVAHRVEASAPGYRTDARVVVFDRDVDLLLPLAREVAAPATSAPSVSAGAAAHGRETPGTDLKAAPKPKHTIDEKDPY
jgi:serine/threonine-protein kinase